MRYLRAHYSLTIRVVQPELATLMWSHNWSMLDLGSTRSHDLARQR